jgi:hypothetical protein
MEIFDLLHICFAQFASVKSLMCSLSTVDQWSADFMPMADIIKDTFLLLSLSVSFFHEWLASFDSWSRLSLSLHVVKFWLAFCIYCKLRFLLFMGYYSWEHERWDFRDTPWGWTSIFSVKISLESECFGKSRKKEVIFVIVYCQICLPLSRQHSHQTFISICSRVSTI